MHKKILHTIKAHAMLQPGDSVIIGLSGGADSVVLLHAMLHLKAELGITNIFAAHVNHGLRGLAATADESFCRSLCQKLQVPLQVYQADVRGLAASEALTIEEAGRKLRYHYLQETAGFFCVYNAKIATGHHQNDNAETVVMNLARGAGLRGLCGIPPVNGNIIRPLLNVSRGEIEGYAAAHGLEYVEDASNSSQEYARNRVRHTVLPAIEAAINLQAVQTIANNAAWLREDEDLLEELAREAYATVGRGLASTETCTCNGISAAITLATAALAALSTPIARRVIRLAISHISPTGLSNITSAHIQSVLGLIHMKTGAETHIPGLIAYKTSTHIEIALPASIQKFGTYPLPPGTTQFIPEINLTISVSHTPPHKSSILYCTKRFNYGNVKGTLILRARKPGDTIVMSSAAGPFTKKLQDYFTDKKTPKQKRDSIPVLACGSDILWVLDEHNPVSAKYSPAEDGDMAVTCTCWVSLWSGSNVTIN